jgi:NAD-dependent oxidoreductase involved in siderophore biosynthesis
MGAVLSDLYERVLADVKANVAVRPTDIDDRTDGVKAKLKLIKLMAAGDQVESENVWRTYISTYWKRVSERVGVDRLITLYSAESETQSHRRQAATVARPTTRL